MDRETYNRILSILTVLACMVFAILKYVGIIEYSWWALCFFPVVRLLFTEYDV